MSVGYFRFPTISGERVVFVSEDDLWSVGASGGVAQRLTSNLGEVSYPVLSPDGSQLAFIGREEGASEVYLMQATGGPARRLTFLGSYAQVAGWTPDGASIVFASSYGQPAGHPLVLYRIATDSRNGTVVALGYGDASAISFGPNGSKVIGRAPRSEAAHWKRYRGGTAGRLWIDRTGNDQFEAFLSDLQGNISAPMWIAPPTTAQKRKGKRAATSSAGRIYFVSDHEGVGNLYSCTVDATGLQRHTDHEDFYVRNPTSDGQRIIYHAGADLYLFDIARNQSQRLEIDFRSPRVQRNRKFVDATRFWESYSIHPHGRAVAIVSRGKLFVLYNHEGPVAQLGKRDGVRYRLPEWFNDTHRLFVISDEAGEESIEVHTSRPDDPVLRLTGLDIGRALSARMSPTHDRIALTNHRHELLLIDLSALDTITPTTPNDELQKRVTVVDRSQHRAIAGFDWSPDGCWLTYGFATTRQTTEIRLFALPDPTTAGGASPLPTPNPVAITQPVLQDIAPSFDPDGKFIYFLSSREFNPVSDGLGFNYGFPWGQRPYLVVLRNDIPNPFVPRPDLEEDDPQNGGRNGKNGTGNGAPLPTPPVPQPGPEPEPEPEPEPTPDEGNEATDSTEITDAAPSTTSEEKPARSDSSTATVSAPVNASTSQPASRRLHIDLDGITQRIVPFPVPDGRYARVQGISGRVYFTSFEIRGALDDGIDWDNEEHPELGTLRSFNFKEYRTETLAEGVTTFALSRNRKKLFYSTGRRLRVFTAGEKPPSEGGNSRRTGWIDLHRIRISVDPQSEWQQMMREAWRLQRDHFWNAEMSAVDWQAVFERYYPLIERVSSRSEFSDLLWEMQGELGTSHAYEEGGDYRPRPFYRQGFLGATFTWDAVAAGYRVQQIVTGEPSTGETTSPLLAPAADVGVGDLLLALNGQRLDAETSPAQLLVNYAEQEVLLTLAERPEDRVAEKSKQPVTNESTQSRQVDTQVNTQVNTRYAVVKTLRWEGRARYRAWVNENRRRVHVATDGKIGYVHIPDMGMHGYAEFHRGYLAEVARSGLIIDVRHNGGGHISPLILEKLARRRIGGKLSRWGGILPYPAESVGGPLVALTNEHSASDGDIFCHGFKLLKLGPLIGKRTWGGVVGYIRHHNLVDGTSTTQPEFSHWFEDIGWELENQGAIPDIEVDISPQDALEGRDPQLERAITEVLHLLGQLTIPQPDLATRPSRALPKLPPR